VDFVVQYEDKIIPIEVKSGESTKSKSLGVYIEKYNPQIAIRASLSNYEKRGNLFNIPFYGIGGLDETTASPPHNSAYRRKLWKHFPNKVR